MNSILNKLDNNTIIHVCVVVRDIYQVSKNLAEIFGIEEAPIRKKGEKNNQDHRTIYQGKYSVDTEWIGAFYQMGTIEMELIQPIGSGPSVWKDYLDQHGEGIHHLGFRVKDNKEAIELAKKRGLDVPQTGLFKNGSYAYISSEEQLGFILETIDDIKR